MSSHPSSNIPKAPWHLWLVGILSLLWNAMGLFDFTMTMTKNEGYMSAFTEEQLEFFYGFPLWFNIIWGIAVSGGVLGSVLLLLKQKLACKVWALSLLCLLISTVYNYGIAGAAEVMGGIGTTIFSAVIFIVALFLVIYARALTKEQVLG